MCRFSPRFLPLADLYSKRYAMDGPAVPAVPDDCAGSVRIRGLKAFAAAVSGEPFTPTPIPLYDGDHLRMMSSHQHREQRSEYSGRSDASGGSGGGGHHHAAVYNTHVFEVALRQQQQQAPLPPQYSRAPPGMGSGSGSLIGVAGERSHRSLSGPGPSGVGSGYMGVSGNDIDGRRPSRVAGPGGKNLSRTNKIIMMRRASAVQFARGSAVIEKHDL